MKLKRKVTNAVCAELVGVGRPTVSAVRRMLGISGVRKVYAESVGAFLEQNPDFQIKDAATPEAMAAFRSRQRRGYPT
jgi:hypothetical protein